MKNANPAKDLVNLPTFDLTPPIAKKNWRYDPKSNNPDAEINLLLDRLRVLKNPRQLSPQDLIATFVSRRVLPLQRREHKICHMSSRLDPTRSSKTELALADMARRVNRISKADMPDSWRWGIEPYSRANLPPPVCGPPLVDLAFLSLIFFYFNLTFLAGCSSSLGRQRRTATWARRSGRLTTPRQTTRATRELTRMKS